MARRLTHVKESIPLLPEFCNIRGGLHGYDSKTACRTKKNLTAFVRELSSGIAFEAEPEVADWAEVVEEVEQFLVFWKKYYCGIDPE